MGSATRAALAAGAAELAAAKGTTLETGEQLLAAARALDSSAQLRSLLADPAVEPTEKKALIGRIFSTLSPAATELLAGLASSRWSTASDLVDGVEEIGIRAIAGAAPSADAIVGELFALERAASSDAELELALGSKLAEPAAKAALVSKLLAKSGSAGTLAIARHLVQSPRGRRIGALLGGAADIVADAAGSIVATVTVAAPLAAAQQATLETQLTQRLGRTPRLQYLIDPAVIGGVRVQVGDTVIDGTIATRLADLRLQLAG
ncbi:F0F1 ATP synthase subunit delta [Protaetiibacter mangrovi]|uniref:ATP synthase subunit delta n=1 Tax=Protaetiibacter mangrovi TaxID=2970926 RepID=A0ABT1ZJ27_9MICO|nr:F0F1 ATP synthase subunit delta [Protaetiibacter mangrovi]MCS0500697.1 F0F1 ATP synthase subunit delta [Protaetiibacter mangrovi]TPX05316.1 F0F1 ATP synthase subunit delta [Schumannella luteola]